MSESNKTKITDVTIKTEVDAKGLALPIRTMPSQIVVQPTTTGNTENNTGDNNTGDKK